MTEPREMRTSECEYGCAFYKNAGLSPGVPCRLIGCGGLIRPVFWREIEPRGFDPLDPLSIDDEADVLAWFDY